MIDDEKQLNDYINGILQGPRYARLLHKRFFIGTITGTTLGGQNSGYLCTIQRPGEAGSDGNQYLSINPGYFPQVGDVVECCWRDANVAVVMGPVSLAAMGGAVVKIAEVLVLPGSPVTSATFSNIPQGFRHLEVVYAGKVDAAIATGDFGGYVNGVNTGVLYGSLTVDAGSGITGVTTALSSNQPSWPWIGLTTGTSVFGPSVGRVLFPYYSGSSFYKNYVCHTGAGGNVNIYQKIRTGGYAVVTPITSLTLVAGNGNFISPSVFTMYGIP